MLFRSVGRIYDGDIIPQRVIDGFNVRWDVITVNTLVGTNMTILDTTSLTNVSVTKTAAGFSGVVTATMSTGTAAAHYQIVPWFDLNGNDARAGDGSENLTTPIDVYVGTPPPASVTITGGTGASLDIAWTTANSWADNLMDYYYVTVNGGAPFVVPAVPGQLNYNLTVGTLSPGGANMSYSSDYTIAVTSVKSSIVIGANVIQSTTVSPVQIERTAPPSVSIGPITPVAAGAVYTIPVTVNLANIAVNTARSVLIEYRVLGAGAWTFGTTLSPVAGSATWNQPNMPAATTFQYRATASNAPSITTPTVSAIATVSTP